MARSVKCDASLVVVLLQARAIENQCHVVGINRCGVDGNGHTYSGDSLVADHTGSLLADAGIMSTPAFYVHEHIESGRLQVLLEGYASPPVWIHAVYPSRRHLSSKVQAFVEHVSEQISRAPWALGPDGRPARARV